jgi:nicotinate-nucleotide adenylyltransferase
MVEAHTAARRRVAFFGGSFDPPHLGHLAVARAARDALHLDEVLFAPVGAQPLKPLGSTAPFEDRVAMTELAIAGERGFTLSRVDAPDSAGRPNYTLHTLERLRANLPGAELFCLMGADAFAGLHHWHGAARIPFVASLAVASRPGQILDHLAALLPTGLTMGAEAGYESGAAAELHRYTLRNAEGRTAAFYVLSGLDVEISATDIRVQIRAGESSGAGPSLVPATVARYIRTHGLYR